MSPGAVLHPVLHTPPDPPPRSQIGVRGWAPPQLSISTHANVFIYQLSTMCFLIIRSYNTRRAGVFYGVLHESNFALFRIWVLDHVFNTSLWTGGDLTWASLKNKSVEIVKWTTFSYQISSVSVLNKFDDKGWFSKLFVEDFFCFIIFYNLSLSKILLIGRPTNGFNPLVSDFTIFMKWFEEEIINSEPHKLGFDTMRLS